MAHTFNWSLGHEGKGNVYRDGTISTWNTGGDRMLEPHHDQQADAENQDEPVFRFYISPEGGLHDGGIGFTNHAPMTDDQMVQEIVAQHPAVYDARSEDMGYLDEPAEREETADGGYGHAYNLMEAISKVASEEGWADFHAELKLPRGVRREVRKWADKLEWPAGSEKEDQRRYHITILSMDEYDEGFAKWMRKQIRGREFHFESTGMDIFGDEHVVLRLESPEWTKLVESWEKIADKKGLEPHKFDPPKAHITIGKSPNGWPQGVPDPHIEFNTRMFNINKNAAIEPKPGFKPNGEEDWDYGRPWEPGSWGKGFLDRDDKPVIWQTSSPHNGTMNPIHYDYADWLTRKKEEEGETSDDAWQDPENFPISIAPNGEYSLAPDWTQKMNYVDDPYTRSFEDFHPSLKMVPPDQWIQTHMADTPGGYGHAQNLVDKGRWASKSAAWYDDAYDKELKYPHNEFTEMVPLSVMMPYREFDRPTTQEQHVALRDHIAQHGMASSIKLGYNPETGLAHIEEGNHRLKIAEELGHTHVPVEILRSSNKPYGLKRDDGFDGSSGLKGARLPEPPEPDQFGYVPGNLKPSQVGLPVQPIEKQAIAQHIMYHVAPTAHRKRIQSEGLRQDAERRNDTGHEPGTYLWDNRDSAWNYATQGKNMYGDMDIHQVDMAGLPMHEDTWVKDNRPDRLDDFNGAWYYKGDIEPERISTEGAGGFMNPWYPEDDPTHPGHPGWREPTPQEKYWEEQLQKDPVVAMAEQTIADELKQWLDSFAVEQSPVSIHHNSPEDFQPQVQQPVATEDFVDPPSHPYKPYDWAEDGWEESPLDRTAAIECPKCGGDHDPTEACVDIPLPSSDYQKAKQHWYDEAWSEPGQQARPVPQQQMHWRDDSASDIKFAKANDQQGKWSIADTGSWDHAQPVRHSPSGEIRSGIGSVEALAQDSRSSSWQEGYGWREI